MAELLSGLFSGDVGMHRVNPVGIAVMIAGLLIVTLARSIVKWTGRDAQDEKAWISVKLIGLMVAIAGTAITIFLK